MVRSTSGFTPSSSNRIGTDITTTNVAVIGLAASTTYYFVVRASDSAGESTSSNQASAITQSAGGTSGAPIYINAGGNATGGWIADVDFNGGTVANPVTAAIDTSLIPSPIPSQAVYQTERYGAMTYTIGGLAAGHTYNVQLHFAETYWSAAGQRKFNVLINGVQKLTDFDILANAGAANKAIEQNFAAAPGANNNITIQFTVGSVDLPKIDGIPIF